MVLDVSDELKIERVRRVPSWARLFKWINKYVLPNLYIYNEVLGSDKLLDVIAIQESRLSDVKKRMLEQYLKEVCID